MLLAEGSGFLTAKDAAVMPGNGGVLASGEGEEQELDTEKLLLVGCLMSGP